MATIKVIFRKTSLRTDEGNLYYRIIHRRRVRQIHTGDRIARDEWDDTKSAVVMTGNASRQEYLKTVQHNLNENLKRLAYIVAELDRSTKEYSVEEVARRYHAPDTVVGFISFTRKIIEEKRELGKESSAEHCATTLNSLIRFYGHDELPFERLDSRLMVHYETYLRKSGLAPNSISFYMRRLRAIYNEAVDRNLATPRNPFRLVYTGVSRTAKRALTLDVIKSLRNLDLRREPLSELARDMFLFSFYTRGMAMVDMAYLRKTDIRNGILVYRRHKTGQVLSIRWEERMQEIVSRHANPESEYLLPLIKPGAGEKRRQYLSASHLINRHLKELGTMLGLNEPLTMYRARHSWASIAHNHSIPISVISQGMGHDSEKTTRIYLSLIDASVVDEANNDIISLLDA